MDQGVEVLSLGRERISVQVRGRSAVPFGQHFFRGLAAGRKTRMYSAARLQIAEPLPPVHAVEPGLVPEGLQHSLVAASPLPKDDRFPRGLVEQREIIGHGAG